MWPGYRELDSPIWYEWTKAYDASCPAPECAPFNDTSLRDPDILDLHQTVHRLEIPRSSRPPIVHHIWVHNKIFGPDAMDTFTKTLDWGVWFNIESQSDCSSPGISYDLSGRNTVGSSNPPDVLRRISTFSLHCLTGSSSFLQQSINRVVSIFLDLYVQ